MQLIPLDSLIYNYSIMFLFVCFVLFKMESHDITQPGLELLSPSDPPSLSLRAVETIGRCPLLAHCSLKNKNKKPNSSHFLRSLLPSDLLSTKTLILSPLVLSTHAMIDYHH